MYVSAADYVKSAETKADTAFSIFDARATAATPVRASPHDSLASLLKKLPSHLEARTTAATISADLKKSVAEAVGVLDQGIKHGEALLKLVDFIEHGGQLSELDPKFAAQALAIREAHLAGIVDASGLVAECRRSVQVGIDELKRSGRWAEQTQSAAKCASAKLKVKVVTAIGASQREIKACEDSSVRHSAVHNWRYGPGGTDEERRKIRDRNLAKQHARQIAKKLEAAR